MRLGLIGHGISSSLSPAIYKWFFESRGLDAEYALIDLPPSEAGRNPVEDLGLYGANVTKPYKVVARSWVSSESKEARRIGAINLIWREGGKLWGGNSDWSGFLYSLKRSGVGEVSSALVLGYGGAARAAIYALGVEWQPRIIVAARRVEAARSAVESVLGCGGCFEVIPFIRASSFAPKVDLVVNATPVGWGGSGNPIAGAVFEPPCVVMDMVYRPLVTPLLETALEYGCEVVDGLWMLAGQASVNVRVWFGEYVDPEVLRAAAIRGIRGDAGV